PHSGRGRDWWFHCRSHDHRTPCRDFSFGAEFCKEISTNGKDDDRAECPHWEKGSVATDWTALKLELAYASGLWRLFEP
ncbi:hypothetical protein, partial [Pantoea agglomerans]|uniref:hypothetical protein n=1 Tax=Enterobacter agglomerans TaxID=549 RepID=UPI003CF68687